MLRSVSNDEGNGKGRAGRGAPAGKGATPRGRASSEPQDPGPGARRGRIRVQAGDKCVAPAKSKARHRKAVPGTVDLSDLSMDAITWSDEVYGVEQLVHAYGQRFPVIVKVIRGYYGAYGPDLSEDQVLQVHSYGKQRRLVAVDTSGTRLSIPSDYPMEVFLDGKDQKERWRLVDAVDKRPLPWKGQVISVNESAPVTRATNVAGKFLRFRDLEEEVFLRANPIKDGWIEQSKIYVASSYLAASFSVAVGMRGANVNEWTDYYGMFARSVRHLNFSILTGYKGIVAEEGPEVHSPSARTSVATTVQGPVYENLGKLTGSRLSHTEPRPAGHPAQPHPDNTYQNMPDGGGRGVRRSHSATRNAYDNQAVDFRPEDNMLRRHNTAQPVVKGHQRGATGNRPETLDFTYDVISHLDVILTQPPHGHVSTRVPSTASGGLSPWDRPSDSQHQREISPRSPGRQFPDVVTTRTGAASPHVTSPSVTSPNSRPGTPFSDLDENDVDHMFESVIQVAEDSLRRQRDQNETSRAKPAVTAHKPRHRQRHETLVSAAEQRDMERIQAQRSRQATVETIVESPGQLGGGAAPSPGGAHLPRGPVQAVQGLQRQSDSSGSGVGEGALPTVRAVQADIHREVPPPQGGVTPQGVITPQGGVTPTANQDVKDLLSKFESPSPNRKGMAGVSVQRGQPADGNSQTPRAVVPPTVKTPGVASSHKAPFVVTVTIEDTLKSQKKRNNNNNHTSSHSLSSGAGSASDVNANTSSAVVGQPEVKAGEQGAATAIRSMEDVPAMLDGLAVEDVCQCLRLLNMDGHVTTFRRHQVDGTLLSGLKETVLVSEFKVTPFNASKLMRFARGWRPKIT